MTWNNNDRSLDQHICVIGPRWSMKCENMKFWLHFGIVGIMQFKWISCVHWIFNGIQKPVDYYILHEICVVLTQKCFCDNDHCLFLRKPLYVERHDPSSMNIIHKLKSTTNNSTMLDIGGWRLLANAGSRGLKIGRSKWTLMLAVPKMAGWLHQAIRWNSVVDSIINYF